MILYTYYIYTLQYWKVEKSSRWRQIIDCFAWNRSGNKKAILYDAENAERHVSRSARHAQVRAANYSTDEPTSCLSRTLPISLTRRNS